MLTQVSRRERALQRMRDNPSGVEYRALVAICEYYFGSPRSDGGSHVVFKTPWSGDPRVNIQRGSGGKAKAYQVKQVLAAIDRLNEGVNEDVS